MEKELFLGSDMKDRQSSIKTNLHVRPQAKKFRGKRLAIVDDSTVRGNNSKRAAEILRERVGVKDVIHLNYTPPLSEGKLMEKIGVVCGELICPLMTTLLHGGGPINKSLRKLA